MIRWRSMSVIAGHTGHHPHLAQQPDATPVDQRRTRAAIKGQSHGV